MFAHWFVPLCGYASENVSAPDCPGYEHDQVFQSEYCPVHGHVSDHESVHDCYVCGHNQRFESVYCHAQVYDHVHGGHDHGHGHDRGYGHHPCLTVHEVCSLQ